MNNQQQLQADLKACQTSANYNNLLTVSGFTLDLNDIACLDWNKSMTAFWVLTSKSRWDSDGEYYENAPYITGDDCQVLLTAWDKFITAKNNFK
jgi:hypothetical protein